MPTKKSIAEALTKLLDTSDRPLYVVDPQWRIVFCNAALAAWIDLEPRRIIGRRVEFHSEEPRTDELLHADTAPLTDLCPPPAALAGEACSGTISCLARDGHLRHRAAEFIPLAQQDTRKKSIAAEDSRYVAVLVLLAADDLTPQEVTAEVSGDPTADELHRAIRRFRRGQAQRYSIQSLLGSSSAMQKVRAQVEAAAASNANTLIYGHPGSGRSHVALAVHYRSSSDLAATVLPIRCETLTDDLMAHTLERLRAARTGSSVRPTLLLENLEQMSVEQQSRLLDAIRQNVASTRILATVDSSISQHSASDEPPDQNAVKLDPQLVGMISTIEMYIPRLIDRLEDLPLLAQYFLESCNRSSAKQVGSLRSDALDSLAMYGWPGELNQLRETIEAAHAACTSHVISAADLPPIFFQAVHAASHVRRKAEPIVLDKLLASIEREAILRALAQARGNKSEAATLLGMTRPRLYRRLIQLGMISSEPPMKPAEEMPEFIEQEDAE